jgi:hypothetical protein
MKHFMLVKALVGLMLCLSMSGCVYLAVERKGEFFPSTRDIWNARQKYFLPPTLGGLVCCFGATIPYVGLVIFYPPGLTLHLVEGCVIAPAYDIVCMPYDLCQRPTYLAECRRREETWRAEKLVHNNLDAALDDGRCLSPSNTVYYKELSKRLSNLEHNVLTVGQVSRIVAAIRGDEILLLDMCGVANQDAMKDDDREWFVQKAIELKRGGRDGDGDAVATAVCRSRKLSDAQYEKLIEAGFSAGMIASSKQRREIYNRRIAEKAKKEAARRKAEEERQARIRDIKEKERREYPQRFRRTEEMWKRLAALKPFVDALFCDDVTVFRSALKHVDEEPLLWDKWAEAILYDNRLREVRHEYLVALLELAEREPEKGKDLKKAILSQKALGEELALKYYEESVSAHDEEKIMALLRNPALPVNIVQQAYTNSDFVSIRYAVAKSQYFSWPSNCGSRKEFIEKSEELFQKKRRGDIDDKTLNEALDALMKVMLPADMPENWRWCILL